jgi:hypothetical protein
MPNRSSARRTELRRDIRGVRESDPSLNAQWEKELSDE